ncbi:MAG TPA: hypothetical protein VE972_02815 [Conexibacter sp.]|nr:hypothetical protein [Conexibacter sp.]
MANTPPIACSLPTHELPARLAEIGAVGRAALRAKQLNGARAILRFERHPGIHERLAAIVAAEARCCAFLTMTLTETPAEITLTIAAPTGAEHVLQGLLAAF